MDLWEQKVRRELHFAPAKKGGAMIKRDTKSVSGMETGPKAEVKAGVRKAMTYRGVGGGKKK